jgi:hypothetical protein
MASGMQVAASRNTALCSMPSGPKMKLVKALRVTIGWPVRPVWVRSTIAVAYLGEAFLSPSKVKSMSRPVAVSPPSAPPLGASTKPLTAAYEIVGQFACVFQERIGLDVNDLELRSLSAAGKRERDHRRRSVKRTHCLPQTT